MMFSYRHDDKRNCKIYENYKINLENLFKKQTNKQAKLDEIKT